MAAMENSQTSLVAEGQSDVQFPRISWGYAGGLDSRRKKKKTEVLPEKDLKNRLMLGCDVGP